MRFPAIHVLLAMLILFIGCKKDDNSTESVALDVELEQLLDEVSNNEGKAFFTFPNSDEFGRIPSDPKNPLTKEKVALGQLLYHETGLSVKPKNPIGKGTYACVSCHFASAGFQAGRHQGIAEGGVGFGRNGEGREKGSLYPAEMVDVQPVRSPATLNIAYQTNILWNGQFGATGVNEGTEYAWKEDTPIANNHLGYEGTETQAIAGLTVHRMDCEEELLRTYGYKALFDAAFSEVSVEKRYDVEHAGLAIAAYERTLLANQAPFQRWLRGNYNAMSDLQKEGAVLFFGKAECANCHTGPALNKMDFVAIGMKDMIQIPDLAFQLSPDGGDRLGRGGFTEREADNYKFKIPQLYNLKDSPFYGHGSSMRSIREVIEYKNRAVKENSNVPDAQLSPDFKPLNLSNAEITALTEFIENALHDPNLDRYIPERVLSGNCFPFNDPLARDQLGCD